MHVGVEETVGEHLGEEDLDPAARQRGDVDAGGAQALGLADRDAVHALHGEHRAGRALPDHLGHDQHVAAPRLGAEIAAQLAAVGGLSHQVELVVQVLVELGHDLARLEPPAVWAQPLDDARHHAQERHVLLDDLAHARAAAP